MVVEKKKYIIELPENTHWIQWLMEGTKDHHPYMDFKQVEDLTPYTESEAYQSGYEEGYKKCLSDSIEAIKELPIFPSADMMRNYLIEYCTSRSCHNCPLNHDEFVCGRGAHFRPAPGRRHPPQQRRHQQGPPPAGL